MNSNSSIPLNLDSPAVQAHTSILQGIITRMAENSRFCKAICITVLSAILVIAEDADPRLFSAVTGFVLFMFWLLDSRYLEFEREYRSAYNEFVEMLHAGEEAIVSKLYFVPLPRAARIQSVKTMFSFSTFWFYLMIAAVLTGIFILKYLIIPQ